MRRFKDILLRGIACTAFVWFCGVEMIYDLEDICPESSNTVHTWRMFTWKVFKDVIIVFDETGELIIYY